MDIDSYQQATEAHLPSRKRRPWWRWNLITLAVLLFVLLWTRELLQFAPSSAWLMAATIFFLWAILPVPWGDWSFTTMPDYANESPRKRVAKRKAISAVCRLLAFFLAISLVGSAMVTIYFYVSNFSSFGGGRSLQQGAMMAVQFASVFVQFLFHLAVAAVLWLLAEALEKLDHVTNELRGRSDKQDKEARE